MPHTVGVILHQYVHMCALREAHADVEPADVLLLDRAVSDQAGFTAPRHVALFRAAQFGFPVVVRDLLDVSRSAQKRAKVFRETNNSSGRDALPVPRPAPRVQNEQAASRRRIHLQVEIILVAVRRRDACRAARPRKRIQVQLLTHVRRRAASVVGAHAVARLVKQHTVDHREALCAPQLHTAHRVLLNPVCAARGHIHLVHPVFLEKQRVALIIHSARPATVRPDRRSVAVRAHACIFAPHVEAPKRARVDLVDKLPFHRAVLAAPEAVLRLDNVVHVRQIHRGLDSPGLRRSIERIAHVYCRRISIQHEIIALRGQHRAVCSVCKVVTAEHAKIRVHAHAVYLHVVAGHEAAADPLAFEPHHRHVLRCPFLLCTAVDVWCPCLPVDVGVPVFRLRRFAAVEVVVCDPAQCRRAVAPEGHAVRLTRRVHNLSVPAARLHQPFGIDRDRLLPVRAGNGVRLRKQICPRRGRKQFLHVPVRAVGRVVPHLVRPDEQVCAHTHEPLRAGVCQIHDFLAAGIEAAGLCRAVISRDVVKLIPF